jgi:hypothetical protein
VPVAFAVEVAAPSVAVKVTRPPTTPDPGLAVNVNVVATASPVSAVVAETLAAKFVSPE